MPGENCCTSVECTRMPLEPGFLFTGEAAQVAKGTQGERDALREVRNRGSEKASPLKTAQLATGTPNAISPWENRGTDSGHGGSHYCSWFLCQAPSLPSTLVELLTSNRTPDIVIASCSAQPSTAFLQLLLAPPLRGSCPSSSPTRLSTIMCRGTLDLQVVMRSLSARAHWGRVLDLIHSTVSAEIAFVVSEKKI